MSRTSGGRGEKVGVAATPTTSTACWMRSAGHRRTVLRASADTVGIGVVYARGCLSATVVFVDQ